MSQDKSKSEQVPLKASDVCDYLKQHPCFLIDHPDVLSQLVLAEEHHPDVTSLVARQHKYFQLRIQALEQEVSQILSLALEHEHASNQKMLVISDLLQCQHLGLWLETVYKATSIQYGIDEVACTQAYSLTLQELWKKRLTTDSYVGRIHPEQSEALEFKEEMNSALLVPLHIESQPYILAFGHRQAHHFDRPIEPIFFNLLGLLLQQTWSKLHKDRTC